MIRQIIREEIIRIMEGGYLHWFEEELAEYVRNQNNWISANAIKELINKYPITRKQFVYRGLFFEEKKGLNEFINSLKGRYVIKDGYSSWTRDRGTAKQFATTIPVSGMGFMDKDFLRSEADRKKRRDWTNGYGVMLGMIVPKGKAIDVNLTSVGSEDELLVLPGSYKVKVLEIFKPHKEEIKNITDINKWVQNQRGMGGKTKMQFSMMEYILQNHPEELNNKSKRHLFNLFSGSLPSVRFEIKKSEFINLNPFPKMPVDPFDYTHDEHTWSDLDKRKARDDMYKRKGKSPAKVKDNDYGKEELTVNIKAVNFNYNLIYFTPLLLPKDMKKLNGVLEKKFDFLYMDLIQLTLDYPDAIFDFKGLDLPKFKPFLSQTLYKKINSIMGKRLKQAYKNMSSVETTDWINSLSGDEQQAAMMQMVSNMEKLFGKRIS